MKRDRGHRGWLALLLVVVLVGGVAGAWRLGYLDDLTDRFLAGERPDPVTEPAEVEPPPGIEVPAIAAPEPVATAATGGRMRVEAVRRALAAGLADPDLGRSVHVAVADLATRATSAYELGDGTFTPASTMKLVTGVAVLDALGPDHRFATSVVAQGRTLTLVGGGDPLLAREPDADDYPDRADVVTLARQTAEALRGRKPVTLRYDATLFAGPGENPFWRDDYVPDDIVAPTSPLWVDQGRELDGLNRVADPALTAAQTFAAALQRNGVRLTGPPTPGAAPRRAEPVAQVESPPLSQIVEHVVEDSDNEGAEVLARHVGLAVADDGSYDGATAAVGRTLADLGVPLRGTVLHDGSGLARSNRLTADALLEVLRVAGDPDRPDLRAVVTGLPVGGFTGSLDTRFDEAPAAGVGRIRAKTGSLTGVRALAGIAIDQNGTPLAFVLAADRLGYFKTLDAQQDLDNVAAALGACRCSSRG